MNQGACHGGDR